MKSKAIQFLEANQSGERLLGILALREIIARLGGITSLMAEKIPSCSLWRHKAQRLTELK